MQAEMAGDLGYGKNAAIDNAASNTRSILALIWPDGHLFFKVPIRLIQYLDDGFWDFLLIHTFLYYQISVAAFRNFR